MGPAYRDISPLSECSMQKSNEKKICLQAEEISTAKRFAKSRLIVAVMAEDVSPPVLQATATIGKIRLPLIEIMRT